MWLATLDPQPQAYLVPLTGPLSSAASFFSALPPPSSLRSTRGPSTWQKSTLLQHRPFSSPLWLHQQQQSHIVMGSSSRKDGGSGSRGSTPPGSGSTSPTSASVAAEQAKRARANSIGASITQGQLRRRKRDMPHELWRRLIRLKDANGRVKLGLFLGLAAALWLLLIFTAPDQPSSNSNSNAKPAIGPAITSFDTAAAGSFDGASLASIPPQAVAAASSATASAPTATTAIDYSKQTPPTVAAQVLRRYPHDSRAFTQGLLFDSQGQLWESTGMYGESEVRRVDLDTGVVVERWSLPDNRFGEGMAMMSSGEQEQLVQLTWREHDVFVYDAHNLTLGPLKRHRLATEGWGITTMPVPLTAAPAAGGNVADVMTAAAAAAGQQQTQQQQSEQLIVSDGSSTLQFIDPDTFEVRRKLQVRAFKNGRLSPVRMLNELEWISGHIYANVWQTNSIAVISPDTGIVQRWIDVRALHPSPSDLTNATPNGIAFDQTNGKMYVTGKLWPVLYEIKFVGPA